MITDIKGIRGSNMTSAASIVEKLQDLITKFAGDDNDDGGQGSEISKGLLSEVETLKLCSDVTKDEKLLSNIHSLGITLWNKIVGKKAGKKIELEVCATARYVSLQLTFLANFQNNSQNTLRKQLAMALKTGREWLDCSSHTLAENCFVLASECHMKLVKLLGDGESSSDVHLSEEQLLECHGNMVRVLAFRAEVCLHQSQHATALDYIVKAKEILTKCPQLAEFLSGICYNFGLDLYQKELYSYSTEWLRESLAIGAGVASVNSERQATTGQLLAIVYLELKDDVSCRKALEAIESSILFQNHIKSLFLKLKILMQLEEGDSVILTALDGLLESSSINMELALESVSLFKERDRKSLCHEALEVINKKYPRPQDNIKVQLAKLEIYLADKQSNEAMDLMKTEILRANCKGIELEKNDMRRLNVIIWEQAQEAYEKKEFLSALQWYNHSLELMKHSNDHKTTISKLQRNRCSCLIELQNLPEATLAAEEAEKDDPTSPHVHFLICKISLLTKNDEKALCAVERLGQIGLEQPDSEIVHGLLCLAAQISFEIGNRKVSELLLERMLNYSKIPHQSLVTIRCLTRLKFSNLTNSSTEEEINKILELVEKAYQLLSDTNEKVDEEGSSHVDEVIWFNKISWNLALSCCDMFNPMQHAFLLCYRLSILLPDNMVNCTQQKSSILMAIGCGLQLVRNTMYDNEKNEKIRELLGLVEKCKDLTQKLQSSNPDVPDSSSHYLFLYEFETKVRLGNLDVESLFEKTSNLPSGRAEMFENYANIALSIRGGDGGSIGVKALKLAIQCHLDEENVDYAALSKIIHSLLSVSLQKGGKMNESAKDEAFNYYQDAMKIIESLTEGTYPEIEIVWMMTKAWNCGINFYSGQCYEAAEKWCLLSMKFLKFLKDMKNNYEDHMTTTYADVINSLQKKKHLVVGSD